MHFYKINKATFLCGYKTDLPNKISHANSDHKVFSLSWVTTSEYIQVENNCQTHDLLF